MICGSEPSKSIWKKRNHLTTLRSCLIVQWLLLLLFTLPTLHPAPRPRAPKQRRLVIWYGIAVRVRTQAGERGRLRAALDPRRAAKWNAFHLRCRGAGFLRLQGRGARGKGRPPARPSEGARPGGGGGSRRRYRLAEHDPG